MVGETISVREARLAAGLSQSALAESAGISRQAVGAIEAGHNRPSVDAALAISSAVGRSVESLFATASPMPEAVFGAPAPVGSPVLAARVGSRLVYATTDRAFGIDGWPRVNAILSDDGLQTLPAADLDAFVIAGCDPALALLAASCPPAGSRHLVVLSASTAVALEALRDGRIHAALVHGPRGRLPDAPRGALRLNVARWRVGLAGHGSKPPTIAELCGRGARVVQRDPGASTQKAFLAAVAAAGCAQPKGPLAASHLEVARRVANDASAGVTMEPAALSMGLAFTPIEEHVVELWVAARWRHHAAVGAIGDVLRSAPFISRLSAIRGYDVAECGTRVSRASSGSSATHKSKPHKSKAVQ